MTFDSLAPTYDNDFTHNTIGRYLRRRVHDRLMRHFRTGDSVLELGCGTGEDALFLAQNGIRVHATDASTGMIDMARAKIGDQPLVHLAQLDLKSLPHPYPDSFNGAFSNFGVLNCLEDWRPLAAWLAERVLPGGVIGFGVMSPFCVWEIAWHGLHGDLKTATRRLRNHTSFETQDMIESITYPTIKHITDHFEPYFARMHVEALGLTLPTSDAFGVIQKRPALLRVLTDIDRRLARYRPLALLADHYWIEFKRKNR